MTGSKNAVKGFGFFIGAVLLGTAGFHTTVLFMAVVLTLILLGTLMFMPSGLPGAQKGTKMSAVWPKDPDILSLSLARVFLFGARDTWFVVGIPVFFYSVLSDGTVEGNRNAFFMIGSFMAVWIIFYGIVQASAPKFLARQASDVSSAVMVARFWVAALTFIPFGLALTAYFALPGLLYIVVAGLLAFAIVFAFNSALHSYLILAFSKSERVTMDVGFYYMANAAGRLLGTFLSGFCFQMAGVWGCLAMAAIMSAASWFATGRLAIRHRGDISQNMPR